ncbi:MAG: hypothetical protein SGJ27_22330 [Candidatus Melainabacteria bacterium]|nr:hypothetical protein [Candidatus Melainabacteria bacterium]
MTSAISVEEQSTWVSDFGPVPYESLDLDSQQYEVRSFWLADFRIKAIGEAIAFAAKFDSPEVFAAFLDIKGDEGYIHFEIKANTRPMTLSLRYAADRWSAVDGRGAHVRSKVTNSDTAIISRGVLTVFHAFLDAELLAKICEQLEITPEMQSKLFTRVNFKEKTFSLVASEAESNEFPPQKPYKTSIIPQSPAKTGESMNAQEETAETAQNPAASVEPSQTEATASDAGTTESGSPQNLDTSAVEIARAEVVAWAGGAAPDEAVEEEEKTESATEAQVEPQAPVQTAAEIAETTGQLNSAPAVETIETAAVEHTTAQVDAPTESAVSETTPATKTPEAAPEAGSAESNSAPQSTSSADTSAPAPGSEAGQSSESSHGSEPTSKAPAVEATTQSQNSPAPSASQEPAVQTEAPRPLAEPLTAQHNRTLQNKNKIQNQGDNQSARSDRPAAQNAAKNSDSGVLGKLAVKDNDDRNNDRNKREKSNRDNNASQKPSNDSQNSAQNRTTNFAPQNNRSIEAPRAVDTTPKYHTYSQSEVDSLVKRSADAVTASVSSKINKQTKTVEDTLKNQEFLFKQALEQINKQTETANQKLEKALTELGSASSKQKDEFRDTLSKEVEEIKSQMSKKVNQSVKVIDSKLEQLSEVKKPKPAPAQKASATARNQGLNPNVLLTILGVVVLLSLVNGIMSFNAFERIGNLENALKTTQSTSTQGDVPIPDLMKDQINKENSTAPAPVQP